MMDRVAVPGATDRILVFTWSARGMTDKERVLALVECQPDDASFDDIVREIAFERMIELSLKDEAEGRTLSHEEVRRRIEQWRK
jgi:hypothetical protein